MPVATQASLKGLTPEQLEETGCRLCLNNTYHLWDNPVKYGLELESLTRSKRIEAWTGYT